MAYLSSGNEVVDIVGTIDISGNVVPQNWYRTITRPNGKPHLLAILILSDIVYWYRPVECRSENNGHIVGWKKKFKGDRLQKSYNMYCEFFGESKNSVRSAMDVLEKLGVIKRIFEDLELENGMKLNNVMYIDLIPERLKTLTFETEEQVISENGEAANVCESAETQASGRGHIKYNTPSPKILGEGYQNNGGGISKYSYTLPENDQGGVSKGSESLPQKDMGGILKLSGTNTENTTEITYTDHSFPSAKGEPEGKGMRESYVDYLRDRLSYYELMRGSDWRSRKDMVDSIISLIADVAAYKPNTGTIRISRRDMPYEVVKSRLLKIDQSILEYVIDCLEKNTTEIVNEKAYLLTALYNAPDTMAYHYKAQVQHDFYREEDT